MFCDACGATLQPGQQFCTHCGKAVVGPVAAGGGRVQRHLQLLGILWIVYSAFIVLAAVVVFAVGNMLFVHFGMMGPPGPPTPPMFLRPLLSFIGVLLAAKGIAGIIAGLGLLQRQPWARVLAIVLGIIGLFSLPFGTALGIYTLWALLGQGSDTEYRQLSGATA